MSEETSHVLDLGCLDMGILFADLGPEDLGVRHRQPEKGFWKSAFADPNMACAIRKGTDVHIDKPICPDFNAFAQKIAEKHRFDLGSSAEAEDLERPDEVDDQVKECTPQFILRNIPKIEHYYDLDRPLSFNIEDPPVMEASDLLDEVRGTHIGKVEFIDVKSVEFVNDFRDFIEEIFYLCPWDQITKDAPSEDNPWHISHSTAKLSADLLSRKNTLFIFTEKGMTQVGMKAFKPRKEKAQDQEVRPSFARSYGPG